MRVTTLDDLAGLDDVTIRAQEAGPGTVFAALAGTRVHGARFAGQAVARGAAAILTDPEGAEIVAEAGDTGDVPVVVVPEPRRVLGRLSSAVHGEPSSRVPVVAVTGTSGKTTTTHLVEAALTGAGRVVGLIGTTGSRIGETPVRSALTTPEAPDLQRLLATMVAGGAEAVAAEFSSHALRLGRVDGTTVAVAAFLNLSRDHLDFHPDMEDYFHAKAALFVDGVDGPGRVDAARRAVVVVDDEWGLRLAGLRPDAVTVSASAQGPGSAQWWAGPATPDGRGGQVFTAHGPGGPVEVSLPLVGRFNVANALVALAIAAELGFDPADAARGMAHARVPGRVESVDAGQDFEVLVDYAHKPAAVEAVLETVRAQTPGRVGVVLGAGGDRDRVKRPMMGAAAARVADAVFVTDDNPRSEDPAAIRAEVMRGAHEAGTGAQIRELADRAEAIAAAVRWAGTGDCVVVAGKGHETGQEVAGVVHPFDDREVARAALLQLAAARGTGETS